jgi:CheY-like chemotaxis protein
MVATARSFGYPEFGGRTILVIDDHQDSAEFLAQLLGFCGATVLTAWSTAHARAQLRHHTASLIICDFQMPRETGVEFMRWLRTQRDHSAGAPAIAVTAYPRSFLKERDKVRAFDAYFEKPIEVPRFLGLVEALLLKPKSTNHQLSA